MSKNNRVFFDTNNGELHSGYYLNLPLSLNDLNKIGAGLQEGMLVVIYMTNEVEMDAYLKYDEEKKTWVAMPVIETIRYLGS